MLLSMDKQFEIGYSKNWFFHEAPGRQTDYKTVTSSMEKDYVMGFVTHKWMENDKVAKQLIKIKAEMIRNY